MTAPTSPPRLCTGCAHHDGIRPKLLDLYSGHGGAGMGYFLAGFCVEGVDIEPQPHYPFTFHQGDAVEFLCQHGHRFAAVHGSPPCLANTVLRHSNGLTYIDLIPDTRDAMTASGLPYVIENVPGAPLRDPFTLCGSMFGLGAGGYRLKRHRECEVSFPVAVPVDTCHADTGPVIGVYGGKTRNRRHVSHGSQASRVGTTLPMSLGREAMGMPWANGKGLSLAIPPAYTEHIGTALLAHLHAAAAA